MSESVLIINCELTTSWTCDKQGVVFCKGLVKCIMPIRKKYHEKLQHPFLEFVNNYR